MVAKYLPDGAPSSFHANMTPCDETLPGLVLRALDSKAEPRDPTLVQRYQSIVGAMLYCAINTRPDLQYTVAMLCRAMAFPTEDLQSSSNS